MVTRAFLTPPAPPKSTFISMIRVSNVHYRTMLVLALFVVNVIITFEPFDVDFEMKPTVDDKVNSVLHGLRLMLYFGLMFRTRMLPAVISFIQFHTVARRHNQPRGGENIIVATAIFF